MSTPTKHTSGPDVLPSLVTSAFTGAVATVVLIPAFREIFAQLVAIQYSLSSNGGTFSQELSTIVFAGNLAFVLLPVASTVGSIFFAYSNIGIGGVVLYLIISSAASGMLLGSTMAVLTFIFGSIALTVIFAFRSKPNRRRPVATRR